MVGMIKQPIPLQHTQFHLGYQPSLDGIRGFAVLWVIAFHFHLPLGRAGLLGVDVFFALSGFLITVLLAQEWQRFGNIQLGNFYMRRVLRLYPALLLLLLVIGAIASKAYLVSTLFYFTNWIMALHLQPVGGLLDHAWSLSVEEQYYLFWPVFLFLMLRLRLPPRWIVLITGALGMASAVYRIIAWNSYHDWYRVYMGTDMHADGLLLGSAFGLATVFGLLPSFTWVRRCLPLATLLSVLFFIWVSIDTRLTQDFVPLYGNLGVSIATLILISRLTTYPSRAVRKVLEFSPLVITGGISYGLYLWHAPIGMILDGAGLPWNPYLLAAGSLLTFAAAGLSSVFLEKPILRIKSRFSFPPHKPSNQSISYQKGGLRGAPGSRSTDQAYRPSTHSTLLTSHEENRIIETR